MKRVLLPLGILMAYYIASAQNPAQQVIATAGDNLQASKSNLSWTIGEVVISSHSANKLSLTQGFHQGKLRMDKKAPAKYADMSTDSRLSNVIDVFPNPTSDFISVSIIAGNLADLTYNIYDLAGREYFQARIESELTIADLSSLASGHYILVVRELDKPIKEFRIIKNQ